MMTGVGNVCQQMIEVTNVVQKTSCACEMNLGKNGLYAPIRYYE